MADLSYLQLRDMPGPPEAAQLQLDQVLVRESLYRRMCQLEGNAHKTDAEYLSLLARYNASVQSLQAALGPSAHCNQVDCDLWAAFSDVYKAEHGFRPRGHYSHAHAQQLLNELCSTSAGPISD